VFRRGDGYWLLFQGLVADWEQNAVPPTLNLYKPDVGARFNFVPREAQKKKVRVAMSNSFGFGGTNASLVFSALD
jgi:3-oxoacyl-[acyl-carrier-protein] synthase II